MSEYNREIIADSATRPQARRTAALVFAAVLAVGGGAALYYAHLGLTLSHYDARAHLVVARRVIDSLTPGWRQLGGVWLPLPHLVALPFVAWDWAYRTSAASVAISVAALAAGLAAFAHLVVARTGARAAAFGAAALVLLNPNVLYLQSTPMTEPLLFGLSLVALAGVDAWARAPSPGRARRAGAALAALALTRYEGWAIAGALVVLSALTVGEPAARSTRGRLALAPYLAATVAVFLLLSWGATGNWFVASGFFTPDNPARHHIGLVVDDIVRSTRDLGGSALLVAGLTGGVSLVAAARRSTAALLPLALVAAAALPASAFYAGHPHRIRYMIPLVVACGTLAAFAIARVPRRVQGLSAVALVSLVAWQRPPLQSDAPMVLEAQWETPFRQGREAVSSYLDRTYDGTPILASMGSLGHYMQDTAAHGLRLADFLHEGNGDLWQAALAAPSRHVRWILIEERAEGGDALAHLARDRNEFLEGFRPVAEGGGLVLYRRE